jgi:hypothetical protein
MIEKNLNAQASILDRLLDYDPKVATEPVRDRLSVRQIKDAVIRDLENLLNTRRQILVPPPEYHEVHSSLYMYGLQDFTMKNCLISSISTGGSGGEDRLTENISINFGNFQYEYTPQKEDGSGDSVLPFGFDIAKNVSK